MPNPKAVLEAKLRIPLWTKSFLESQRAKGARGAKTVFYFKWRVSSTNDVAKKKAFQNPSSQPLFVLSVKQSRGRGFGDKKWENSDLMLSVLWESKGLQIPTQACEYLAGDLKKALEQTWPELRPLLKVKAPNDLYLKEAKVAGLLLEVLKQGQKQALILGLGLNVFHSPPHLPATHLATEAKKISSQTWSIFLEKLIPLWSKTVKSYSSM